MSQEKYIVNTKSGERNADGSERWLKHHVNNLISYANYLDTNFPKWCFFNVFDKETRLKVAQFTKNSRPSKKTV